MTKQNTRIVYRVNGNYGDYNFGMRLIEVKETAKYFIDNAGNRYAKDRIQGFYVYDDGNAPDFIRDAIAVRSEHNGALAKVYRLYPTESGYIKKLLQIKEDKKFREDLIDDTIKLLKKADIAKLRALDEYLKANF